MCVFAPSGEDQKKRNKVGAARRHYRKNANIRFLWLARKKLQQGQHHAAQNNPVNRKWRETMAGDQFYHELHNR